MKSILTCFLLLGASVALGQTAALKYNGGTYSFGEQYGTGTYAAVKIRPISAEKALFCIDVELGEPDYEMGFISGVIKMNGAVGIYEKKDNDVTDIKLQFVFKTDQLTVSTLDGRNGYGYSFAVDGMHPNYVYKLTNKSIPQYFTSNSGYTRPFIEAFVSMVDTDGYYLPRRNEEWSDRSMKSGSTFVENQIWYKNDSLNQVTVHYEEADRYYKAWQHFYKDQIPLDMLEFIRFYREDGTLSVTDEIKIDFAGFVDKAVNVGNSDAHFFESIMGVNLGDTITKAYLMYGVPNVMESVDGYERLIWLFKGEDLYDPEVDASNTKLVSDCFEFNVMQYYKEGKLVAQMLEIKN